MVFYRVNVAEHCRSRRLNSHSGRARGGIVPRLHREITLESARLRRTPRPPRPPQGSPSYGSSALAPARRYPRAALIGPRVNARPDSLGRFWVVNQTVGSRLEKRRVSNQVTARPPPPSTARHFQYCTAETLAAWSMAMEHGAWDNGARPVLGFRCRVVRVRCGAIRVSLHPSAMVCVSYPEA